MVCIICKKLKKTLNDPLQIVKTSEMMGQGSIQAWLSVCVIQN